MKGRGAECVSPKPCDRSWCGRSSSSSSQRGEQRPLEGSEGCDAHSEWSRCSHGQQPCCSEKAESHTGDVGEPAPAAPGGGSPAAPPPGSAYDSRPSSNFTYSSNNSNESAISFLLVITPTPRRLNRTLVG